MKRRTLLARSITACGATFLPTVTSKADKLTEEPKEFKASLKKVITAELNAGFTQGIGFWFLDEEFGHRRIVFEVDQGCSPNEVARVLREMADACEDPRHPMWVKGDAAIGQTVIKPVKQQRNPFQS